MPQIRSYDYVNGPYEQVRDALRRDALAIFRSATKAAASRAQSVAAALRMDLGGIEFATDINISIQSVDEKTSDASTGPVTRMRLEWHAAKMPALFPVMRADLLIYPLTSTETQLDFSGVYEPPFGPVGKAIDAVLGRRVAEASVHRFVGDIAEYLRNALGQSRTRTIRPIN